MYPNPHNGEKPDPDQHLSQNLGALKATNGPWRAVDASLK